VFGNWVYEVRSVVFCRGYFGVYDVIGADEGRFFSFCYERVVRVVIVGVG
jgi:hypothetical protein